ncbi:peptidase C14, caspase domain-containing protein [Hysterangium stoloniferum]|nr:peptidase C14, caspase domain-containing protein [Hysterangium stoloniferum]
MSTRLSKVPISPIGNTTPPHRISSLNRRRALLVAISYKGRDIDFLAAPLNELPGVERFLKNRCGFDAKDIVVLSDHPAKKHIRPTRENILKQLGKLVDGAESGDHFFFWFNGHGKQITNENRKESDGRDECIPVSFDFIRDRTKPLLSRDRYKNIILDDDLRKTLVAPLPAGAHLVALIDCCNSGTMLDLPFTLFLDHRGTEPQQDALDGHAISISASFDGKSSYSNGDPKRSLLTKAFIQTIQENFNPTIQELLQSLTTLISKDLPHDYKQNPQMGFSYRAERSEKFSI